MATRMLDDPAVRAGIADQVVSALEEQPLASLPAVVAHPLLENVVGQVVASDAFQEIFHQGVVELHVGLLQGRTQLLVEVDDTVPLVKEALRLINPVLADSISDAQIHFVVGLTQSTTADRVMDVADLAGRLALPLASIAVVAFVLAVVWSRERRRATQAVGGALVMLGVTMLVLLTVGGLVVRSIGNTSRERETLSAMFGSVTHLLDVLATSAVLMGAVTVIAASFAGTGRATTELRRRLESLRGTLQRPRWRVAACIVGAGAAFAALLRPLSAGTTVLRVAGFVALVIVVVGLLEVVGARRWTAEPSAVMRRAALRLSVAFSAALGLTSVALLGIGLAAVDATKTEHHSTVSIAETGCNGHIELCDRRVDQVVFAGTHNSMAAAGADGRWWFARQTLGIEPQLNAGVRALLLDLHFGVETNGMVRSDFRTELERQQAVDDIAPDERAVMERLLAMMGLAPPEAKREVYLCHGYCEFGAIRAVEAFHRIEAFLLTHPNEVVLLFLEDHLPPAAAVEALEQSGLGDRAYTWQPGTPLPTLRTMIESGRNVLIMVEHESGGAPWYQPAFDHLLQETGYRFETVDQMSCTIVKGEPDNPMLLVNHWLDKERTVPADASAVNVASVLKTRAERCAAERHRVPNILAVDFYNQGDLIQVVDELNGVVDGPRPSQSD